MHDCTESPLATFLVFYPGDELSLVQSWNFRFIEVVCSVPKPPCTPKVYGILIVARRSKLSVMRVQTIGGDVEDMTNQSLASLERKSFIESFRSMIFIDTNQSYRQQVLIPSDTTLLCLALIFHKGRSFERNANLRGVRNCRRLSLYLALETKQALSALCDHYP